MTKSSIYRSIVKDYNSYSEAGEESELMITQGYRWFSGYYTLTGFSVEYRKYGIPSKRSA